MRGNIGLLARIMLELDMQQNQERLRNVLAGKNTAANQHLRTLKNGLVPIPRSFYQVGNQQFQF